MSKTDVKICRDEARAGRDGEIPRCRRVLVIITLRLVVGMAQRDLFYSSS